MWNFTVLIWTQSVTCWLNNSLCLDTVWRWFSLQQGAVLAHSFFMCSVLTCTRQQCSLVNGCIHFISLRTCLCHLSTGERKRERERERSNNLWNIVLLHCFTHQTLTGMCIISTSTGLLVEVPWWSRCYKPLGVSSSIPHTNGGVLPVRPSSPDWHRLWWMCSRCTFMFYHFGMNHPPSYQMNHL